MPDAVEELRTRRRHTMSGCGKDKGHATGRTSLHRRVEIHLTGAAISASRIPVNALVREPISNTFYGPSKQAPRLGSP
jgi:hypothetical protein